MIIKLSFCMRLTRTKHPGICYYSSFFPIADASSSSWISQNEDAPPKGTNPIYLFYYFGMAACVCVCVCHTVWIYDYFLLWFRSVLLLKLKLFLSSFFAFSRSAAVVMQLFQISILPFEMHSAAFQHNKHTRRFHISIFRKVDNVLTFFSGLRRLGAIIIYKFHRWLNTTFFLLSFVILL